jgi:hypothetical protein
MRRALILLVALAPLWCGAAQKRKAPRPPDVRIIEVSSRRSEGIITVDGRVENCSPKPITKLTLEFLFRSADAQVITTQRGVVEEGELAPGEESEFHWKLRDHARAVSFTIEAVDDSANYLVVEKPGPYPVD